MNGSSQSSESEGLGLLDYLWVRLRFAADEVVPLAASALSVLALLRAVRRVVVRFFDSEPSIKIVEVWEKRTGEGWVAAFKGSKLVLLESESEETAIDEAAELLRGQGGGEIVGVDGYGRANKRVWVLPTHQLCRSLWKSEWRWHRWNGWKPYAYVPMGFSKDDGYNWNGDFTWELIDLLKALIGEDNVAVTGGGIDNIVIRWTDVPPRNLDEIGIYVRCSRKDLASLRKSERWFCLVSKGDWGQNSPAYWSTPGPRTYALLKKDWFTR